MIGLQRKQPRLQFLKNIWMERVKDLADIRTSTSFGPKWACAIGRMNVGVKPPAELDSFLFNPDFATE